MFTGNNGTVLLKNTSRKGRKENYHEVQEIKCYFIEIPINFQLVQYISLKL